MDVFIDGFSVGPLDMKDGRWSVLRRVVPYDDIDPPSDVSVRVINNPDQSLTMIVIVATARNGRSDGKFLYV